MNTRYIPSALILALLLTKPVLAEDTKQPSPAAEHAAGPEQKATKGKVLETMSGAGYTYLLIEEGQNKVWAAIPESKITVGQDVAVQPGMVMKSFESKALNKTFDQIIFSPGLENPAAKAPEAKHAAEPGTPMDEAAVEALSGGSTRAVVPAGNELKVPKAEGANAHTVAECFTDAAKLDKQTVRVRGKVVKFSPQIMGKNWIHIQDGSGDPTKNTHDLVATTLEEPKKDAVVMIEGVLSKDKDFGAGYKYIVILEDVKVVQ
jgi:hypothetical protein